VMMSADAISAFIRRAEDTAWGKAKLASATSRSVCACRGGRAGENYEASFTTHFKLHLPSLKLLVNINTNTKMRSNMQPKLKWHSLLNDFSESTLTYL
jgi:hypothetical protein